MDRIFNMDNKFFVFMGKVADLIIVNLLCIACCIPIVTAGASITALYYVTMKMVRNEEAYIVKSFFKSFKENFKQATIIHLIMLVTGLVLFFDLTIVRGVTGGMYRVLFCVFIAFAFLYVLLLLYIYPVLAKFYNTVRNTFTNSFLMAIRHLPFTILMLAFWAIPVLILLIPDIRIQSTFIMLFFMFGFAAIAYGQSFFFRKIFDHYIPKENEEEPALEESLPDSGDSV